MRQKVSIIIIAIFIAALGMSAVSHAAEYIEPSKEDKCPVCGMFVHKYPKWIAELIFNDGTYAVFDGPKDMFKYYFNIEKYNKSKTRDDIADIHITEYYTTKHMNAKDVFFVTGSDVYGPMGIELIPVKGEAAAHSFMKDHKGKKVLRFSDVTMADLPGMMHGKGQGMPDMKGHGGMKH